MKIYKITEASEYLGVSINTLKTLANNGMEDVVVGRRKIRLKMSLTNLIEFKKDECTNG